MLTRCYLRSDGLTEGIGVASMAVEREHQRAEQQITRHGARVEGDRLVKEYSQMPYVMAYQHQVFGSQGTGQHERP